MSPPAANGHATPKTRRSKDSAEEESSPGTTRYSRAVKMRSPNILEDDSPKTVKMPKLRKSGQLSSPAPETSNGVIKKPNPDVPAVKKQIPELKKEIPELKKQIPQSKKEVSEVNREMPQLKKEVPESKQEIPENLIQDKALPKRPESAECSFGLGQLAWAVIGNYPYWPCVVTSDPETGLHAQLKTRGRNINMHVHVQYFGDKGRHGWVAESAMIPFTGRRDFDKLAIASEAAKAGLKKKEKNTGFIVKPFIVPKWEIAIYEAEEVLPLSNDERTERFNPQKSKTKYEKLLELAKSEVKKEKGGKRERSDESPGPAPKRLKRESLSTTSSNESVAEPRREKSKSRKKIVSELDEKISINTPPTPPSSNKDSSDESSVRDKVRHKKIDLEADFELYYERNRDMIEDMQPDATEAEIRTYLQKTWAKVNSTLQSQYYSGRRHENNVELKDSSTDHEEESSVDSDSQRPRRKYNKKPKSAKIVEPVREESIKEEPSKEESIKEEPRVSDPIKRTRPYNLFRRIKQERVCQICERTGDLTMCKGPCFSYFHLACVKPGDSSSEFSMDEDTSDTLIQESKKEKEVSDSQDSEMEVVDSQESKKEKEIFDSLDSKKEKEVFNSRDSKKVKEVIENEDDDKNDEIQEEEDFKCIDCLSGVAPSCFICNEREDDRIRCSVIACGKHYHTNCLKLWPQSYFQGGQLTCPFHVCHTCTSDNPQNAHACVTNERLVRCVRCPSAYHAATNCLPAGSEILTGSQIICPKHYKVHGPPLNATWCFLCTRGGSLICCDTCPTSFHLECLGIDAPDGAFICEDCETGRLPLYGEVVWVKLGNYRWWPSRICYPWEIPLNLEAISHRPGEFCVMFLGTNNYYWVHRGRVFLYQDGDANAKVSLGKKNVDEAYKKAMEEANEIHQQIIAAKDAETQMLKPPPYGRLKVNKPVGNVKPPEVDSIVACDCEPHWENPCGPDSDCLNRILMFECSPGICPAGPKCNNQAFVRRQYPAMEPFHTVGRGWGLRTLECITEGQFIIEYVGEVIDEAEYKRRLHHKKEMKNENFYFLTIDTCRMIDAEPKGNLSRFMNHSCQPNCETQKWTVNGDTRVGLFALRDIEIGEELTFNYNLACDGETRKPCLCGAPNCSGFIGLKAQKQPLTVVQQTKFVLQQTKIEKAEKVKVQRRQKTKTTTCWTCGVELSKSDESLMCSQKTCTKRYHKACLNIEENDSKLSCPWHHCKECGRRTGSHCSFCSTAYCPAHLEGNLLEYKDKDYVCQNHEDLNSQKSVTEEEDKEESENEPETDKETSSISSDSSASTEKTSSLTRDLSPRVSIVEVEDDTEEDDSQTEDNTSLIERLSKTPTKNRTRVVVRKSSRNQQALRSLTPSQLEMIIGGTIVS